MTTPFTLTTNDPRDPAQEVRRELHPPKKPEPSQPTTPPPGHPYYLCKHIRQLIQRLDASLRCP